MIPEPSNYVVQVKDGDWWVCLLTGDPESLVPKTMTKSEAKARALQLHSQGEKARICTIRATRDFTTFENFQDVP